jgi:hypothetical protein
VQSLTRWFETELDSQGALKNLEIAEWGGCVRDLLNAEPYDGTWPDAWVEPLTRLIRGLSMYSRPDGTPCTVFEEDGPVVPVSRLKSKLARHPAIARAIKMWLSNQRNGDVGQSTWDWSSSGQAIGMLRPGGPEGTDFLAIDHRRAGEPCRFELFGGGRSWLGPTWKVEPELVGRGAPKPLYWSAGLSGSLAEWCHQAGEVRITYFAMVLRGRSLALLAALIDQRADPGSVGSLSLSLPPGIGAESMETSRALALSRASKRGSALVLPIGLPALAYPTERGDFLAKGGALVLNQAVSGVRCWLPLLVSWDANRNRKALHWRLLSVSEKSRNVPADRAWAVRVSWGRNENYLIYRSLAEPATRAFLGHQTTARFLVGLFHSDGTVEPIMSVE